MSRGIIGVALVGCWLFAGVGSAEGRRIREFTVADLDEALAGEFERVGVTGEGALFPSPATTTLFSREAAYVWGLLPDGDGGAYAATGSEGRVYHIAGNGDVERLAETFEYELFALTGSRSRGLYVSGAPNGTITHVSLGGVSRTVLDVPEGLVWDLLLAPNGVLYAATGERGEVYRVSEDGEAERVGRIPDAHVVSLGWWNDQLLCGTDGRGLLVAMDPENGDLTVLFDTNQEEVVAILPLGPDRVVFAANGGSQPLTGETANGGFLPPVEVTPAGNSAKPALYELGAEKLVRRVWECSQRNIFSLAAAPDGSVLVGTGTEGILYRLDAHWNASRLLDFEEAQVLTVVSGDQHVFVGTGNAGAIYRLDWDKSGEGTFTTRVWDAGLTSEWGRPSWVASGRGGIACETRSGQLAEPDETWSEWEGLSEGQIQSPPGRFLQCRMVLSGRPDEDLRVRQLTVPYRGPNRRPRVDRVRVSPKGAAFQSSNGGRAGSLRQKLPGGVSVDYIIEAAPPANGAPIGRSGIWARTLRSAVWSAEDADQDELRFDLYLRLMEDAEFLPLKLDLEESAYTWDATAWPEGWYELKVVARDEETNPPGDGLTAESVSSPFQVDNTPPRLRDLKLQPEGEELILSGRVTDDTSRITTLEISLDGEGWQIALPDDGMLDSRSESFRIPVPSLEEGRAPSVVGVRAADEVGHVATSRLRVPNDR